MTRRILFVSLFVLSYLECKVQGNIRVNADCIITGFIEESESKGKQLYTAIIYDDEGLVKYQSIQENTLMVLFPCSIVDNTATILIEDENKRLFYSSDVIFGIN